MNKSPLLRLQRVISPVASSDIMSNIAEEQTDGHGAQSAKTMAAPDNDTPESVHHYPSRTLQLPDRFVPFQ